MFELWCASWFSIIYLLPVAFLPALTQLSVAFFFIVEKSVFRSIILRNGKHIQSHSSGYRTSKVTTARSIHQEKRINWVNGSWLVADSVSCSLYTISIHKSMKMHETCIELLICHFGFATLSRHQCFVFVDFNRISVFVPSLNAIKPQFSGEHFPLTNLLISKQLGLVVCYIYMQSAHESFTVPGQQLKFVNLQLNWYLSVDCICNRF